MTTPTTNASEGVASAEYLTFRLRERLCGIPIPEVAEIIEYRMLTGIPAAPDFAAGMINLRSRPLLVLDPGCLFFGSKAVPTKTTCIVVIQADVSKGFYWGIMVDSVHDVAQIPDGAVKAFPDMGSSGRVLRGVASVNSGDGLLFLLRAEVLWNTAELDQVREQFRQSDMGRNDTTAQR